MRIDGTLWGTLSILEAAWLLINIPGLIYAVVNYLDCVGDEAVAVYEGQRAERAVAKMMTMTHRTIALFQASYVLVGVISALTPPPIRVQNATLASVSVLLIFVCGSLTLTYLSWYIRRARYAIRRLK